MVINLYRIGQSSDIHQLVKDRKLILGGVHIESEYGLLGHSDADALLHAISEAIIGAMAMGDLGKFFPDNDPQYKGIDSLQILSGVNEVMLKNNYQIVNIDSLIMIEKPKMAPHIENMVNNIAKCLGIESNQVNVKATRGEKLGYVGRSEGVLAQAVVMLKKGDNNEIK